MITTDSVSSNSPLHNTNNISKSNINENLNKTKTKIKNKYDLSFEPNVNKPFNHYNYYYQKSIDNNYNYSYTPSTKIYYPEPFIASPTFVHNDI